MHITSPRIVAVGSNAPELYPNRPGRAQAFTQVFAADIV